MSQQTLYVATRACNHIVIGGWTPRRGQDTVVLAAGPDDAGEQGTEEKRWHGTGWWTRAKAWWWVGRNQARFS